MSDTFLVTLLKRGGCSHGQATAFERCLEDRPICGVGVGVLVRCLLRATVSDMDIYVAAVKELEHENKRLRDTIADDMFHMHNVADAI